MARYRSVWSGGRQVAEYEGDKLVAYDADYWENKKRSELSAPMIMRDIGEYRSPIDNQMITSRSAHRDHIRQHDVIEVGNEKFPTRTEKVDTRPIGEVVKEHLEKVKATPQREYESHVHTQKAEHASVASLVTAS